MWARILGIKLLDTRHKAETNFWLKYVFELFVERREAYIVMRVCVAVKPLLFLLLWNSISNEYLFISK